MKSEFKCPRCGGPYFGRDINTGKIECHCDEAGRSFSRTAEEIMARVTRGKPCGWTGEPSECGLALPPE